MSFKEIRRRDPYDTAALPSFYPISKISDNQLTIFQFVYLRYFSLPDFVSDVQEIVKPVLKAYNKVSWTDYSMDLYVLVKVSTYLLCYGLVFIS